MSADTRVDAQALESLVAQILERAGVQPQHAADAARVLLYASRRGVDTHGVRNVSRIYIRQIDEGMINLTPQFAIEHETPVSARVDGDRGLGLAGAVWGMRLAIEKARQAGVGLVAMRNSWHYGAAGFYPWLALQEGMIGISSTGRFYAQGGGYGVVPTFAAEPKFSTNPLAFGFPTLEEPPYLLDMATSVVPFNRITLYKDAGTPVHPQWGIDAEGRGTTDAAAVRALFPLGGSRDLGGHKGTGLAMVAEVLAAVLSGEWADGFDGDEQAFDGFRQARDAHFFAAFRVDLFRPAEEFRRGMDVMIRSLHAAKKQPDAERILVAGELEHETEQERLARGVPLPPFMLAELQALADRFGVEMPAAVDPQMSERRTSERKMSREMSERN